MRKVTQTMLRKFKAIISEIKDHRKHNPEDMRMNGMGFGEDFWRSGNTRIAYGTWSSHGPGPAIPTWHILHHDEPIIRVNPDLSISIKAVTIATRNSVGRQGRRLPIVVKARLNAFVDVNVSRGVTYIMDHPLIQHDCWFNVDYARSLLNMKPCQRVEPLRENFTEGINLSHELRWAINGPWSTDGVVQDYVASHRSAATARDIAVIMGNAQHQLKNSNETLISALDRAIYSVNQQPRIKYKDWVASCDNGCEDWCSCSIATISPDDSYPVPWWEITRPGSVHLPLILVEATRMRGGSVVRREGTMEELADYLMSNPVASLR